MKIETLAKELAELAYQKEQLTNKEDVLKEMLLNEMHNTNSEKEKFEFGTVSVVKRSTYSYSDAVKKMEEKIKIKKEDEVRQGIASEKVSEFITFRKANKE